MSDVMAYVVMVGTFLFGIGVGMAVVWWTGYCPADKGGENRTGQ